MKRKLILLLSVVFVCCAAPSVFAQEEGASSSGGATEMVPATGSIPTNTKPRKPIVTYEATAAFSTIQQTVQGLRSELYHGRISLSSGSSDVRKIDQGNFFYGVVTVNHASELWVIYVRTDLSGLSTARVQVLSKTNGVLIRAFDVPISYMNPQGQQDFVPRNVDVEIDAQGDIYLLVSGDRASLAAAELYVVISRDGGQTWMGADKPLYSSVLELFVSDARLELDEQKGNLHMGVMQQDQSFKTIRVQEHVFDMQTGLFVRTQKTSIIPQFCGQVFSFAAGANEEAYSIFSTQNSAGQCQDTMSVVRPGVTTWSAPSLFKNNVVDTDIATLKMPGVSLQIALSTVENPVSLIMQTGRNVNENLSVDGRGNFIARDIPITTDPTKIYSSISGAVSSNGFFYGYVEDLRKIKFKYVQNGNPIVQHVTTAGSDVMDLDIQLLP